MEIPNRSVFRAAEVCELAGVQPYVLRSWESEFPDLGVAKSAGGPRMYRRADGERVLRIKQLILAEGLTLAGARRKLMDEGLVAAPAEAVSDTEVASLIGAEARESLRDVRRGLQWILGVLSGQATTTQEFALSPSEARASSSRRVTLAPTKPAKPPAKPAGKTSRKK